MSVQSKCHVLWKWKAADRSALRVTSPPYDARTAFPDIASTDKFRHPKLSRRLSLLGLAAEAKAFLDCLAEIYKAELNKPVPAINDDTMLNWRGAVSAP
jgi:hypothetical protein